MINLSSIKQDIAEYVGVYSDSISDLGIILKKLTGKHTESIYFDDSNLQSEMHKLGADPSDIYRVCLMTKVSGFRDLISNDIRTQQVDLDRFVQNAVDETGFDRMTVMKLVGDIALSVGIAYSYNSRLFTSNKSPDEIAYIVPIKLYEAELETFKEAFDAIVGADLCDNDLDEVNDLDPNDNNDFDSESQSSSKITLDFNRIQILVAAGVPKAKYYLGYCLLNGVQIEENIPLALRLLKEAADAGDGEAAGALGDYYFNKGVDSWEKSYEYYTGFGAIALNDERKKSMISIFNQKRFNRRLINSCFVLLAVLLATVIIAPGSPMYASHIVFGTISILLDIAIITLGILHYRVKPYDTLYFIPVGMFIVWTIYMAIRFGF